MRVLAQLIAVCFCTTAFATPAAAEPAPIQLLVDGQPLPAPSPATTYRIPAPHKSVSFSLGLSAQEDPERTRRMRFYLEGVDSTWRQISSEMCLIVRFADDKGDQMGQRIFPVDGISPAWSEDVLHSGFTARRETVRVPAGAASVTFAISSSGPPTAMGVYMVRALKLTDETRGASSPLYEMLPGDSPAEPVPAGWVRTGTRPSMAQVTATSSGPALGIIDDDPTAHAEWSLGRASAVPVRPGAQLALTWSEMHHIGMGNRFDVNYGTLSAGTYRFWSEELSATGTTLSGPRHFELVVLLPFWKSVWFWLAVSAIMGLLLWLLCRAFIRRRLRLHPARLEQEHVVARERLRIARDLHDDLGARLTHISLMSGLAENAPQSATSRESFQRISGMARELVAALYQTVWTVNPEHDHLEALVNYIGQLTQNLTDAARLRCRIHSSEVPGQRRVTSEVRHHVILAVKEALHNAIKHSGATEITARTDFTEPDLTISIADNGRGFDAASAAAGNGLANMRHRMAALSGRVSIESALHQGTTIHFVVPLPPDDSTPPPASPSAT